MSIASGLVASILDNIIFIITIIGTDNSIPTTHHIIHQNHNEIIITRGLRFNLFHIKRGSIIFHISTCTHASQANTAKKEKVKPNWIIAKNMGNNTAIIDQIVGIKFNINTSSAQNKAKSTPKENNTI